MLYRVKLLVISVLSLHFVSNSQVDVVLGKNYPLEKRGDMDVVATNKSFLVGKHMTGRFSMDFYRFDKSTMSFSGQFDPVQKGSEVTDRDYSSTVSVKGKIYLFYNSYNSKTDKYTLFAQALGDDAKPSGGMIKVIEMDAAKKSNAGNYRIVVSRDSSKICVIASPPYEKNSNEKLILATFDNTLKNLNTNQLVLNYKDNKFTPGTFILANDGDLLMQASVYVEKKDREKGEAKTFPTIFKFSTIDGKMDEYQIKVPGMLVNDVDFTLDENNKLICAGFYGDPKKGGRSDLDGIYYLRIDKATKTIEKTSLKPLPDDIIVELIGQRKAKKEKGISNNFSINYFIPRTGGATQIAGQYYDYYTVTSYNPQTKQYVTYHHYVFQGPLVLNVDKNGEITWAKMLPMKQHFVKQGPATGVGVGFISLGFSLYSMPPPSYAGFSMAYTKEKTFFVYNDHVENRKKIIATLKDAKTVATPKFMVPVAAEMDAAGNYTIKQAFDAKTEKTKFTLNIEDIVALQTNMLVCSLNSNVPFFRACFNACTFGIVPLNRQGRLAKLTFK